MVYLFLVTFTSFIIDVPVLPLLTGSGFVAVFTFAILETAVVWLGN